MNEIDELRAEVDHLRGMIADEMASTRRHLAAVGEAIDMLLKIAVPGAAAANVALSEMINVIKAAGGDVTDKEALVKRVREGFLAVEAAAKARKA